MCLAIPGKVVSVEDADPAFRTGTVDFRGARRRVNLAFTPEVVPGDFVLVHVGIAISRVEKTEAEQAFRDLAELGAFDENGATDSSREAGG